MVLRLSKEADMGTFPLPDDTLVAVDETGMIVGFLRVTHYEGASYVNPVVVSPKWQGYGIGVALMQAAFEREGELLFVARGQSTGFYEHIGCEPIPWDRLATAIASDCDGCDQAHSCKPQPMRLACKPLSQPDGP